METWSLCEQHGINTMIFHPARGSLWTSTVSTRLRVARSKFLANWIAQDDSPRRSGNRGCRGVGRCLVGNPGDAWTREGALARIAKFVSLVKTEGVIAGVGGHELRTPTRVEKAGIKPDFYMRRSTRPTTGLHGTGST